MSSSRDLCPKCLELGWACSCRKRNEPPAPPAMTDTLVERLERRIAAIKVWYDAAERQLDEDMLTALKAQASAISSLLNALTPSAETKAAYIGEFKLVLRTQTRMGKLDGKSVTVPWDTIKEIMAAIKAHALNSDASTQTVMEGKATSHISPGKMSHKCPPTDLGSDMFPERD